MHKGKRPLNESLEMLRKTMVSGIHRCQENPDGNESRTYLCLRESEKAGKDHNQMRLFEKSHTKFLLWISHATDQRKTALEFTFQSRFVYSLRYFKYSEVSKFKITFYLAQPDGEIVFAILVVYVYNPSYDTTNFLNSSLCAFNDAISYAITFVVGIFALVCCK